LDLEYLPEVRYINTNDNSYGSYDNINNILTIDTKYIDDPSEVLNTLAHELRYAWQYQTSIPEVSMMNSLENYITPNDDYNGYRNQLCESDAFDFGDRWTETFLNTP